MLYYVLCIVDCGLGVVCVMTAGGLSYAFLGSDSGSTIAVLRLLRLVRVMNLFQARHPPRARPVSSESTRPPPPGVCVAPW